MERWRQRGKGRGQEQTPPQGPEGAHPAHTLTSKLGDRMLRGCTPPNLSSVTATLVNEYVIPH